MTNLENMENNGFQQLGIIKSIVDVLNQNGITKPTPIQQQAIPSAIEGKDVVGIAQTGTGKTFSFGLPMIQQLLSNANINGLIMVPTRELAQQVVDSLRPVSFAMRMSMALIIGGAPMERQVGDLKRRPRIIVATPGRLIDHLKRRTVNMASMEIVVLDEADRMLDMGFAPQIEEVMKKVAPKRQTMLFSATMPHEIMNMATKYMKTPVRIEVAPAGTTTHLVKQEFLIIEKTAKPTILEKLLGSHKGKVLVFTRTKHGAKNLCFHLQSLGFKVSELHSNKSLGQRKTALADFKSDKTPILIATDIAARGIDVKEIELVVNYDLPENSEDYVHRIGRTGRAGAEGKAVSFADPSQRGKLLQIERLIRKTVPTTKLTNVPGTKLMHKPESPSSRPPRRSDRSFGDKKPFGERSSFGDKKPFGERKPFGSRPFSPGRPGGATKKPFGSRPPHRRFTDRKAQG